ncbi:MAG: hypothetical protein QOI77_1806 [Blastocatellia bacterium]|jgi:hypothetical protein|nr:hypothetical protein [Blastocatellia bacterium]
MAQTLVSLLVHVIFSTKNREPLKANLETFIGKMVTEAFRLDVRWSLP